MSTAKIIQPQHLCDLLGVKNVEEAKKILATGLSMLAYLSPGDQMEAGDMTFKKISKDLIYIDTDTDLSQTVDNLGKSRILRFPL
jgi:predicted Zn-dependent protease